MPYINFHRIAVRVNYIIMYIGHIIFYVLTNGFSEYCHRYTF